MLSSASQWIGVPIVPKIREDELIQSHMRRIADANLINLRQLGNLLCSGKPATVREKRERLMQVARKLGHSPELAETLTFAAYFGRGQNRAFRKQICPGCLEQDLTTSSLLAESAYAICTVHKVFHLSNCPECARKLFWNAGTYFHCLCGFDLRLAERAFVENSTVELFLACFEDRPLNAAQMSIAAGEGKAALERLKSSLLYLAAGQYVSRNELSPALDASVSDEAFLWRAIGSRIGNCPKGLADFVTGIEARTIFAKAGPEWAMAKSQRTREAICWTHLRNVATTAYQSLIEGEEITQANELACAFDIDAKNVVAIQLAAGSGISRSVRSQLRSELIKLKRESCGSLSDRDRRLDALIGLTSELRSINQTDWPQRYPFEDMVEPLAFIAAGAVQPWAAVQIENWHLFQSDIDRLLPNVLLDLPLLNRSEEDSEPFWGEFKHVFSSVANPSDWLGLSIGSLEDRITKLVTYCQWPICGRVPIPDRTPIPFGFSAFSAGSSLSFAAAYRNEPISYSNMGVFSPSCESAIEGLVHLCLSAQANFSRLDKWRRIAATAAETYARSLHSGKWNHVRGMAEANDLIATYQPFPHKAMLAAIAAYAEAA